MVQLFEQGLGHLGMDRALVLEFFDAGGQVVEFDVGEVAVGDEFPLAAEDRPGDPVVGPGFGRRPGSVEFPE